MPMPVPIPVVTPLGLPVLQPQIVVAPMGEPPKVPVMTDQATREIVETLMREVADFLPVRRQQKVRGAPASEQALCRPAACSTPVPSAQAQHIFFNTGTGSSVRLSRQRGLPIQHTLIPIPTTTTIRRKRRQLGQDSMGLPMAQMGVVMAGPMLVANGPAVQPVILPAQPVQGMAMAQQEHMSMGQHAMHGDISLGKRKVPSAGEKVRFTELRRFVAFFFLSLTTTRAGRPRAADMRVLQVARQAEARHVDVRGLHGAALQQLLRRFPQRARAAAAVARRPAHRSAHGAGVAAASQQEGSQGPEQGPQGPVMRWRKPAGETATARLMMRA
jgi:hypothetical protein